LVNGHVKSVGVAPTLGACIGGAIVAGSTDQEGRVTFTNTDATCTINFAQSYAAAPFCVTSLNTGNAGGTTSTTTTLNVSFAAGPTQFMWMCRGN
jgi:hypothetical protein